ncbi:RNA polymerase sigma-I factor [Acetivibrio cellulolyticus]|uniref:RNA polymerase sigma-I factor n=1 Tax=Acetivibrio cellulolyticus TaxID=35830 RepID=UPI0001E2CC27|nr:RNA polymerase sigma-I factor [Acetivibrio cellulolyticus]
MLKFGVRNKIDLDTKNSIAEIVKKIQAGDKNLKEELIRDNIPHITRVVSNIVGTYVDNKNSEEYSIGLTAFNEAIDKYDEKRNGDFFKYSNMVIKHRIIDKKRKDKRHSDVLPLSSIEDNCNLSYQLSTSNSYNQFEKIELKEELLSFESSLNEYGISMQDLIISSPKHADSRRQCIKIARIIAEDEQLFFNMDRKKCIPLSDLLKMVKVNQKTIVRNRKFIIAVSLILRSNLDDLKEMVTHTERRQQYE